MFPRALKGDDRLLHAALCGELGLEGTVRPLHFAKWVVHYRQTCARAFNSRHTISIMPSTLIMPCVLHT